MKQRKPPVKESDMNDWGNFEALFPFLDDSTTEIEIETPEGWKCERENCKIDFRHIHSTYSGLSEKKFSELAEELRKDPGFPEKVCPECKKETYVVSIFGSICSSCFFEPQKETKHETT